MRSRSSGENDTGQRRAAHVGPGLIAVTMSPFFASGGARQLRPGLAWAEDLLDASVRDSKGERLSV